MWYWGEPFQFATNQATWITLVSFPAEAKADDRPYNAIEQKIAQFKGNEQHRVPNRGRINPKKLSADYTTLAPSRPYASPTFKINFPKFSPLYNFCSVSGNVSNP